jgi:hypothetical protein
MINIHPAEKPETRTGLRKQRSGGVKSALVGCMPLRHSTIEVCKARCRLNTLIEEEGYRTIEVRSAPARARYLR